MKTGFAFWSVLSTTIVAVVVLALSGLLPPDIVASLMEKLILTIERHGYLSVIIPASLIVLRIFYPSGNGD
ncbi:hypothetical protein JXA32_08320 [Candidatus Sumerlaeota bacterium]|nr:hypothetical protein [Candidatus Sumerlaeota bacterium]